MAIALWNGKEVENSVRQATLQDKPVENEKVIETIDKQIQEKEAETTLPPPCFSQSFTEMPSYVKFLKDILTKKRKVVDFKTITLIEECTAMIQNKLLPKLKDLRSFSIPCSIENVLLKVGKLYILVDFFVLEMEEDQKVRIILGCPFLATAGTLIDVREGKITSRVREEVVKFTIFNAPKHPSSTTQCYRVYLADRGKGNHIPPPISEQALTLELKPLPLYLKMKQCYDEHNLPPSNDNDFKVG
ncbi:PREDICTED: uncharacterized protein LOC108663264 [Theobroma cacao]|uniref:Uncharacterized protein LOC108663264 n=1 Tax=Theobroma cacao TaxID=3641 RepID=A0AB32WXW1_THECC|nr:PREDICTED: uncharacterized protein LOC108663264 [Theobroma cacao]